MGKKSSAKKQRRKERDILNEITWDSLIEMRNDVLNLINTSKKVIDDTYLILKDEVKSRQDVKEILQGSYRTLLDFVERCKQTSLLHMEEKDNTFVSKYLGPCVGEDQFKCMEIMGIYLTLLEQIKDVVSKITIELTTSNGMEDEIANKIIKLKNETEDTISTLNKGLVDAAKSMNGVNNGTN